MLHQVIVYFLLLFYLFHTVMAYEGSRFEYCDNSSNYTTNSTFSSNLAQALNTLQTNTPPTGFNATTNTTADPKQPVTALALCRGSLSPSDCQACVDAASVDIRGSCPNQTAAQIWYDMCMLRYSSSNFITTPDYDIKAQVSDWVDAPDPTSYNQSVLFLLHNLSVTAAAADKRYAVGRTTTGLSNNLTVYGYVDCTRDLTTDYCTQCFLTATDLIKQSYATKLWGWILTPSCNVQFNVNSIYHSDWPNAPWISRDRAPPLTAQTAGGGGYYRIRTINVLFGVVVVIVILIVGVVWVVLMRGRKREKEGESAEEMMERDRIGMRPFLYDMDQLALATGNFSASNRLGSGGFGTVYKGTMPNGEEIAVKKLAMGSAQGVEVFYNEVKVLLNMQHRNLVRLLGCCLLGEERMLVYEYLSNKSLDYILFDKNKSAMLDWSKRYNIILGVGRGLLYLHEDSFLRIIHRDIKASNVLLDEQLNPKISDFGLAKLFPEEQSHLRTNRIAGTFGYMAPEYVNQGFLSAKSDVYSFGVLILEIISGRKNHDTNFDKRQQGLLSLTWRLEQEARLIELVDVTMGSSFPEDEVARCMRIGLLCCQECLTNRPTIFSTLAMLSNNSMLVPPAGRPGYHHDTTFSQAQPHINGSANPECTCNCFTVNSITTSLAFGR